MYFWMKRFMWDKC